MKHLEVKHLWVQELVAKKLLTSTECGGCFDAFHKQE